MKELMEDTHSFLSEDSPVSVVIPTYNRYSMLIRLLHSIEHTEFPVREIIVIDDFSDDPSYKRLNDDFPFIKYVRHDHVMYVGESRNDGIRLSKGKYIFMVDDDNTVDPQCIGNLVLKMENDNSIGVAAPVTCYYSKENIVMYAGSIYSKYMHRTIFLFKDKDYSLVCGKSYEADGFANSYMFRKDSVLRVYPIPKELLFGGEDGYIQYRVKIELGLKLTLVGSSRVYHDFLPEQFYSRLTPFKLYYAIRGKLTFERMLKKKNLIFSLMIPIYLVYYIQAALHTRKKINGITAVLLGTWDGLFGNYVNRY